MIALAWIIGYVTGVIATFWLIHHIVPEFPRGPFRRDDNEIWPVVGAKEIYPIWIVILLSWLGFCVVLTVKWLIDTFD